MIWLQSLVVRWVAFLLFLPLGVPFKFVAAWDGVEERFHLRLVMWKKQSISKGGRITLIQITLSSLPIYFVFVVHATIDKIEERGIGS